MTWSPSLALCPRSRAWPPCRRISDPDSLLPALARNVVTNGYQASSNSEALDQTEYLKLLIRYVSQASELAKLAGKDSTIRIATCDSTETGDLLRVLGYRMRGGCGGDLVLETVNPSRAFLTIDSGFPLSNLEQALRTQSSLRLRLQIRSNPRRVWRRLLAELAWHSGRRPRSTLF